MACLRRNISICLSLGRFFMMNSSPNQTVSTLPASDSLYIDRARTRDLYNYVRAPCTYLQANWHTLCFSVLGYAIICLVCGNSCTEGTNGARIHDLANPDLSDH